MDWSILILIIIKTIFNFKLNVMIIYVKEYGENIYLQKIGKFNSRYGWEAHGKPRV